MKSTPAVRTDLLKICHARVGQPVRLPDATGQVLPEVFVVCAVDGGGKPARPGQPHGLYDDGRELYLVSLTTGRTRPMPHLSSRAELLRYEDVVAPVAPVLVPRSQAATALLKLCGPRGKDELREVDLADPDAVLALLRQLATDQRKVKSVILQTDVVEEELAKCAWRSAVVDGRTLKSFEEFRSHPD